MVARAVPENDKPIYSKQGKNFSALDISDEVQRETEFGIQLIEKVWKASQEMDVPASAFVARILAPEKR